jgi:DNA-binding MarR family transcriptional regulator
MSHQEPLDTTAAIQVAELRETLRAFLHESELIAQNHELTPQRHLLLLMIKGARDGSERSTVGELATRLRLAQTSVSDLVARAEHAGLIRRERSKTDARVTFLCLTREGERRLAYSVHDHANERKRLRQMLRDLDKQSAR